jgi:hypothetical protein
MFNRAVNVFYSSMGRKLTIMAQGPDGKGVESRICQEPLNKYLSHLASGTRHQNDSRVWHLNPLLST